jgi:hypothetical protein
MGAPKGHPPYPGCETGGRPLKFQTAQDLENVIEAYFLSLEQEAEMNPEKKPRPPGLFALCVHAGMSYDCWVGYENAEHDSETEKYSQMCKKARMRIAAFAEEQIYERTAGATFQLVNLTRKFKEPYKNAQHQEITGKDGGSLEIALTDRLKEARERAHSRGINP